MKFAWLTGFLFCWIFSLQAVDNVRFTESRARAMGGNAATQSIFYNPSLLVLSTEKRIRLEYFAPYGMKELSTYGAGFEYPNSFLPAGVHISSFGYDEYRESLFRLGLGKRVGKKWMVGVGIQYRLFQTILSASDVSRLSTDLGAAFQPVDNLLIGMLITDFPSFSFGEDIFDNEDIKSYSVQIGFQWKVMHGLLIAGSAGTENEHPVGGCVGMEYECLKSFCIRAGVNMTPFFPSFGIGYSFSVFTLDWVGTYHPVLGISTGLGLSVRF